MTKLKEWCKQHGVSIAQLARELGISRCWASLVANGTSPSTKLMHKIRDYTKGEVKILDFFEGE